MSTNMISFDSFKVTSDDNNNYVVTVEVQGYKNTVVLSDPEMSPREAVYILTKELDDYLKGNWY